MAYPMGWPAELRELPRYLPWLARRRANGKMAKVPSGLRGGRLYPVDVRQVGLGLRWSEAEALCDEGLAAGVGMVLGDSLEWTVLDLDDCLGPCGTWNPQAATLLNEFPDCYAERSPSGAGLHLWIPARAPCGWRRQAGVEILTQGFVTVTGSTVQPHVPGGDIATRLTAWHAALSPQTLNAQPLDAQTRRGPVRAVGLCPPGPTDGWAIVERAARAANGHRFRRLWEGALVPGESPSEGDFTLILMLLYWSNDTLSEENLEALLRASGRARPKWDEPRDGASYLQHTIQSARALRARRST